MLVSMGSKRNRNAGHIFERTLINRLKQKIYPKAVSSRQESRSADNDGVDLCNTPGIAWQCKSLVNSANYHQLILDLKNKGYPIPVVAHQRTEKSKKGKFMVKGEYAILELETFIRLLEKLHR